uniref:Uncharacterized protein n=1 Tax=Cacopsylla melanoneura TaxID=428564 RepID=A0A8D8LJ04_9HEMI
MYLICRNGTEFAESRNHYDTDKKNTPTSCISLVRNFLDILISDLLKKKSPAAHSKDLKTLDTLRLDYFKKSRPRRFEQAFYAIAEWFSRHFTIWSFKKFACELTPALSRELTP